MLGYQYWITPLEIIIPSKIAKGSWGELQLIVRTPWLPSENATRKTARPPKALLMSPTLSISQVGANAVLGSHRTSSVTTKVPVVVTVVPQVAGTVPFAPDGANTVHVPPPVTALDDFPLA